MRAGRRGTATHTAELPTVCQRDYSELRLPSGGTEMYEKVELCISFNQAERRHISITIGKQVKGVILYDASECGL